MSLALCLWIVAVQSVTAVPDPRPTGFVTDQAGAVEPAAEARLDHVLAALHQATGVELVVAIVDDVPGSPKAFVTALFHHWRLGSAAKNDGVLMLLVMGQRRLEIETGDGLQAALPAWWLADMQAADMVPRFKQRDIAGGLEAGAGRIDARLRALPGESERPVVAGEYRSDGVPTSPSGRTVSRPAPSPPAPARRASAPESPPAPPTVDEPAEETSSTLGTVVAVGLGLGLLGGGGYALRRQSRRRRTCTTCALLMRQLDEAVDDAYLDPGQRAEERVGTVDYRVLHCGRCQAVRITRHPRWFAGGTVCPGCRYQTRRVTSTTAVVATYDHQGLVRVDEDCAHCAYKNVTSYATPMRTSSSTSDSDNSSFGSTDWSGSSDSGSSDSGSSDSGSSDSGGDSSGGGAGSSW